jgi:hypothetical protein
VKLLREHREVETFGLVENTGFQIKATAKAFEILSSGLYKDKITAILREISANARDAHIEAGCADRPFNVHLPTTLYPYLSIRDFGFGLSHERMLKVYQTYFASLKEDSNDYIGGLGLGSKSPFAYTEAYTVVSRADGEKRTYDLFKDDNGEPQIAVRSVEELGDEETGLEVIVPLTNSYDTREFATKAMSVYEFYPVKPVFSGGTFSGVVSHATIMEGKGWRVTDRSGYYNNNARAIMGVIAYPIDDNSVISDDDAAAIKDLAVARRILRAPIDIDFPIGSLDITAGREELSYVKATKSAIRRRLVEIAGELDATVQAEFKACKNLYEAKTLYAKLFSHGAVLTTALGTGYAVNFRGIEITDTTFHINMEDFPSLKLVLYKDSKRGSLKFTKDYTAPEPVVPGAPLRYRDERDFNLKIDVQDRRPTRVFIDDLGGRGRHSSRLFRFRSDNNLAKALLVQHDGSTAAVKEVSKLKKLLNGFEFGKVSDLPLPTYERTQTRAMLKVLSSYAKTSQSIIGPKDGPWDETEITVETGGVMVITSRGRITRGVHDNYDSEFSTIYSTAIRLGLIDASTDIVAVPLSMAKQFTNTKKYAGKWINFFDLMEKKIKKALTAEVQQKIVEGNARDSFDPPGRAHDFFPLLKQMIEKLPTDHPITLFKALYDGTATTSGTARDWQTLAHYAGITPQGNVVDLNAEWNTVSARYPMLSFALDRYAVASQLSVLLDYIGLVDEAAK